MIHFYAFSTRHHLVFPIYERTFGCEKAAKKWSEERVNRFYTTIIPPKFFY